MGEPARNVATVREHQIVAPEPTSMLEVIAQAVRDPTLDVEKLERMAALYERLTDRQAETAFNEAMNTAQAALSRVAADAENPQTKSKYASYSALDRAVRPVYSAHGFSLTFGTEDGAPADHVRVSCRVAHSAGHSRNYHIDMPADGKGAKGGEVMTKTHAVGAAMSYGQRYLLKLIFNIAVGSDDDGNSNGGRNAAREMSEVAKKAMEEINGYDEPADLVLWKKNKAAGLEKMVSAGEWQEIVRLWNRRAAAMSHRDGDHA